MSNPWGTNEGFIRPQKSVGLVVFNTRVSRAMMREACSNPTPLWALAKGQQRDYIGDWKRGDVIWTHHDQSGAALDYMYSDPMHPSNDHTTVHALSALNGQGDATSEPAIWEQSVRILGLSEVDKPEGKDRNTTVCGGIHTVRNNGPEAIRTGDTVWVRAPTAAEAKAAAHTPEEKAGVIKFQLRPYRPEMHRSQPKEIYACLIDAGNAKAYLPAYKRHCRDTLDSHLGTAMVAIGHDLPAFRAILATPGSNAAVLVAILQYFGHSAFKPDRSINRGLVDRLFAPYSRNAAGRVPLLFDPDTADETQKKLNHVQTDSMALGIMSTARLVDMLNRLIIGEAKSSADPGKDFSLQQKGYMH